ncbi:haloalkane dehalogenase [Halococcus hamelinensis]|uniref:Haloalkane dehalogenase n=1 Tax=Halococcus hamelinensis 100A6 TaxID=1132509 RepID=M0M069_9EURY|nr:haloalkane dehalogenase [Halococcus hamelinensis]EMA39212.1 haloalkane dehalogenase [Halococcus hamelinensis 100A6]
MALVRTPDDRFEDLPDYPYEANFVDVGGPEMAYVDEGSGDETFLCLHGEPTWGYLYRKLVPTLAEAGRVVVPDFVGFGRSEKYDDPAEYSFRMHYDSLVNFVEALDLTDVTLVCQDWGGILGLSVAGHHPERFARLVPMNTGIPSGDQEMPEAWETFRQFVEDADELPVSLFVENATSTDIPEEVLAAYEAPFPEESYKAGARVWPDMVPRKGGGEGTEITRPAAERLSAWEKPAFVLFSDSDPITTPDRDPLRDLIPTASEQPDVWIEGGGHFLQEDAGEEIAERIVDFVERTR